MKIERDDWLSEVFGYDAFRILVPEKIEDDSVWQICSRLEEKKDPAFYYTKISTSSIDQVHFLALLGFQIIDVQVMFELQVAKNPMDSSLKGVEIRSILAKDESEILSIAENSFTYSRFHLDPLIPDKIANEIKRKWVQSYLQGRRGERLLVADFDGEVRGFLAVLRTQISNKNICVIDLIGVHKSFQQQGIGKALVQSFILQYSQESDRLKVGTQITNIPSIRLYEQCGFRLEESSFVLHGHFRNGKPIEPVARAIR